MHGGPMRLFTATPRVRRTALLAVTVALALGSCQNLFTRFGPPDPISDLAATPADNTVTLVWTDPANADFDRCEITYRTATDESQPFTGTANSAGTTIGGLTNGVAYTFTLTAYDRRGKESESASVTATPVDTVAPGAVTGLVARPGSWTVDLSWAAPSDTDVARYVVTADCATDAEDPLTADSDGTVCTVGGLSPQRTYQITVHAVDDDGLEGATSSTAVTTLRPNEAYLAVAEGRIYGTTASMEYSLDDRGSWSACAATTSYTAVTFSTGDEVWVRQAEDPTTERYLGTVAATSGVDLYPGGPVYVGEGAWSDTTTGVPGDARRVKFAYENFGTSGLGWQSIEVTGYLSTDPEIDTGDTQLFQITESMDTSVGEHVTVSGSFPFTVPDVPGGLYYVGVIMDTADAIAEMVEDNNTSPPTAVAPFRIGDNGILPAGAVKVVNSWGEGGTWENVADGHYWITYNTLKHLQSAIYYYANDFTHVYEPTVLAVFQITHALRDECFITVGLGDPADPVVWKDMQPRWGTSLYSGPEPFPANRLALDISEFAYLINDHDLYLQIENLGTTGGTVDSFSVEFYSDYDQAPFKTVTGDAGAIAGSGSTSFTTATQGALTSGELAAIQPLSRTDQFGTTFYERAPTEEELQRDMARIGVYQPGVDYNVIVDGHGTGLAPPTLEQWGSMVKLDGISGSRALGTLPESVDNAATQYFPPIGNQADEGSCVAFSMGYYIHTYQEAREHGWDLSGSAWTGGYYGEPDSSQDKIMSPDFVYHQINRGVDEGSAYFAAVSLLTQVGGASWQQMPYDTVDHATWPSEAAFRQAARYRGAEVGNHYWDDEHDGYFIIESDADIDLLKQLLAEGYCVSIPVLANDVYDLFDVNDVVDNTTTGITGSNHANTVVGYKEGAAWNPANPDG